MVLPKLILLVRAHGGFRGALRVGVNGRERQVAIHQPDLAGVRREQRLVHGLMPLLAKRALEIAELDDGDGRVVRPNGWIAFVGDLVAGDLRFIRDGGLVRRLRVGFALREEIRAPDQIAEQETDGEGQRAQRGEEMTALERDRVVFDDRRFGNDIRLDTWGNGCFS